MLKSREYISLFDNKCPYCSRYSHVRTEEDNLMKNKVRDYTEGLCANCERSSNCVFARVEGGVWHCSDYIENE